jgi:hypothetical protein
LDLDELFDEFVEFVVIERKLALQSAKRHPLIALQDRSGCFDGLEKGHRGLR